MIASKPTIFLLAIHLLISSISFATSYTWNGSTDTNWFTPANWTPSGNPGTGDNISIAAGTFNLLMDSAKQVTNFTISGDSMDVGSSTLTVTGTAIFSGGTINSGTSGNVKVTSAATTTFSGTIFNVPMDISSSNILFSGSRFNSTLTAEKIGSGSDNGTGGNYFAGVTSIIDSSSGNLVLSNNSSSPDTFNAALSVASRGAGSIYLAHQGANNVFNGKVTMYSGSSGRVYSNYYGTAWYNDSIVVNSTSNGGEYFGTSTGSCTIASGKTISIGTEGFDHTTGSSTVGTLYIKNFIQSGATDINLTLTGSRATVKFEPGCLFYGNVTVSAPGIFFDGCRFLGKVNATYTTASGYSQNSVGGNYFGDSVTVIQGNGANVTLGSTDVDTFATYTNLQNNTLGLVINNALFLGNVKFKNALTNNQTDHYWIAKTGTVTIKGNANIENANSGTLFGSSGGTTILDTNCRITIPAGSGKVQMWNVVQRGSDTISVPMSGSTDALFLNTGNVINGPFFFDGNRILLNGTKFNGTVYIKRTYGGVTYNDVCDGGNEFNAATVICDSVNTSSPNRYFAMAGTNPDDFNADVIFKQYGTGSYGSSVRLYPAYSKNSTFAGNVTVDGSAAISFGANGGKMIFDGSGVQTINKTGSYDPNIKKMEINKSGGYVKLNLPLSIDDTLTFTNGIIITDTSNLLSIPKSCYAWNGSSQGGRSSSYVHGPIKKTGNSSFYYPVGDTALGGNGYHPLFAFSTSDTANAFTVQYFGTGSGLADNVPDSVTASSCEYWNVKRNAGSASIIPDLYYNSICPGDYLRNVVMAYYSGLWNNLGQGSNDVNYVRAYNSLSIPSGSTYPVTVGLHPALEVQMVSGDIVNKWEKYEVAFKLPLLYEQAVDSFFRHYYVTGGVIDTADLNPFSDDSLEVRIDLISPYPSQKHITKWAFFMREAKWSGTGTNNGDTLMEDISDTLADYHWHFRFAPDTLGGWRYEITISTPKWSYPLPSYTFGPYYFTATTPLSDNHGYLKVNPDNNRYLKFEDGTQFFGIGENIWGNDHWSAAGLDWNRFYKLDFNDFASSINEIRDAGGNYVATHLSKWNFAIEWDNLGVYDQFVNVNPCNDSLYPTDYFDVGNRQYRLWAFDSIMDLLRARNIYLKLNVATHLTAYAYQTFWWGDNIYINHFCGGDLTKAEELFKTSTATNPGSEGVMYYWKRMYKYLLSRWGYSTQLAVIETFREIDHALGYADNAITPVFEMCDSGVTYTHDAQVRDAMQFWHDTLISWVKNPAGGLGDTNHLFALSYTEYDSTDLNYNFLFNNSNIDLTDLHSYRDDKDMNRERYTVFNEYIKQRADKPFHFGESSTWGTIDADTSAATDYKSTSKYYNNYDISFHNELWSTAMMGCYATGHTWNWPIVHRWPMTNPEPADLSSDNELGDIFSYTPPGSPTVNDTIKSVFHNYKPLAEFFTNNVYLDQELTPKIFYNDSLGVEIYYLVNQTGIGAYGWIHNLNAYWANKYYYSNLFENYYGCTDPLSAPYTISGFNPNDTLGVYFYPTRMGTQTLPTNYTAHIGSDGNFDFDLPDVPLGCDSINADFAFAILPFGHNRMAGHQDEKKKIAKRIDFSIHPNPTEGKFTLTFSIPNPDPAVKVKIIVLDVTGRIVLTTEISEVAKFNLDLSNAAKGIYFVRAMKGESEKFQKIVIH